MRRLAALLLVSAVACGGSVDGAPFPRDTGSSAGESATADEPDPGDVDEPEEPAVQPPVQPPVLPPPTPPAGERVPVVIAQGHMGRTIMTCDGGQTWVADRSLNDRTRCWINGDPNYEECDHGAGAGRGITWTGSAFIANFGWSGEIKNTTERSTNGVAWAETPLTTIGVGGINAGHGAVVAPGSAAHVSRDDGVTFAEVRYSTTPGSIRRTGYADYDGGRFMAVHDDGLLVSADGGQSWWAPRVYPAGCGGAALQTQGGVAYANGIILMVGGGGDACRSRDGGVTWTRTAIGEQVTSHLTTDGDAFYAWGDGVRLRSSDGATWTRTPMQPSLYLGPATYDPVHAVFVAVNDSYYEYQRFYRSTDGVSWQTLDRGAAKGSHPVRAMAFGYAEASAVCP